MPTAQQVRELEALCPWARPEFTVGLRALTASSARAARELAADARVLATLIGMVPRCSGDERGATPWTSFRREVAVARRVSDCAAAALIRQAERLTSSLPVTLGLLEAGSITVERAEALVRELESVDTDVAGRVDALLAAKAARLPTWRITQEVRRAVAKLDPEAAARRVSVKNATRGVLLLPDADDQATVTIFGPAVPVTRWYASLDEQARALKQAGDPRPLDALRFDLAMSSLPCAVHAPADLTIPTPTTGTSCGGYSRGGSGGDIGGRNGNGGNGAATAPAGLRASFVEAVSSDCRASRPVQAQIVVPVETALGLSNEPGWLAGYGWISAPTCRQLLTDAELRQVCVQTGTGQLVDLAERAVRPPPTPEGVRARLLDMVLDTPTLTGIADRVEPDHDPTEPLRQLVVVRDRTCDGPTGSQVSARRCHLDHDTPHPHGPTAAWNLTARATRTHQLKHYGWTPLRTPTMTIWTSPAGQLVQVPHHTEPPPGIDRDPTGGVPVLPDPHELDRLDRGQLEPPSEDGPPWLPDSECDGTEWTWQHGDDGLDDIAC